MIWTTIIRTWGIMGILTFVALNAWNIHIATRLLRDDPWNGPKMVNETVKDVHETFSGAIGCVWLFLGIATIVLLWPYYIYLYLKNPMHGLESDKDEDEKEDEP